MNNITIKMKLIILALFVSIGFITIVTLENKDINELHELAIMEKEVKNLEVQMLTLRRHEKDFLTRKDLKYLSKFEETIQQIAITSKELKKELIHFDLETRSADTYTIVIKDYNTIFHELVQTQQKIGLNPKDGLYGSLRATVHKVQDFAKKANDAKLLAAVYDLRKEEKDFMLRFDLKYLDKFNSKVDKLISNPDYQNMSNLLNMYKNDFNALVTLEEKKGLNSKSGILGKMRKTIHKSETTLKTMTEIVETALEEKTIEIKILAMSVSITIATIVVLLLLYISRFITISLREFENGLMQFFKFLNNESTDVKPLNDKNDDEIGNMSRIINKHILSSQENIKSERKLVDNTIAVLSEFEKGDLTQRVTAHTSNESLNELAKLLNQMGSNLEKNIDNILKVLKEYEENNFMNKLSTDGIKEHLLRLADGINSLGETSTTTLINRKKNGLTLENNAAILKENVQSLSTSSNEAAASLEETAAALEEITGTITNNTQNVSQMATYAGKVTESASSGETMANKTMSAMDEINEQVKSITEAITVIDKIAFQTNILSLNAAVEAATAGDAGKGFAVVAQEVRNLAARSADAAKEIKEIVETATVKANAGKKIAEDMLSGYKGLNKDIDKTIELISSVDSASKEQKSGIEQINDAITKLDHQTQQNSAAAMETNNIALTTEELAKRILNGVNENIFRGKDSVKIDI